MPHARSAITSRRAVSAAVAALLIGSSVAAIASTTGSTPALPSLPSGIPTWARTATVVGQTPVGQTVWVGLTLRGPADADKLAFAKAVSTPGDVLYRHFLTRPQYDARFAPSAADAATVAAWLKSGGATSVTTSAGNALIGASMPASTASALFGVGFRELSHLGKAIRVPTGQASLPAAIAPLVMSVSGLTEVPVHYDHVVDGQETASPQAGATFFNASPCTASYNGTLVHNESDLTTPGAAYTPVPAEPPYPALTGDLTTTKPFDPCGYTPAQVRGAYGLNQTPYTGKGVTVAIVDAYDAATVVADTNTYSKLHGLPSLGTTDDVSPPGLSDTPEGPTGVLLDPQGWAGEETLDWEAVHTMAPDAEIAYSGAVTPVGPMLNVAVINALEMTDASEVTNSYGSAGDMSPDEQTEFDNTVVPMAASVGVGLEYSTGDSADEVGATTTREVDSPADDNMVTGVGGVGLVVGPNNSYGGEYYWGTYKAVKSGDGRSWGKALFSSAGGGGGVSTVYAQPDYQAGVVPPDEVTNADTAAGAQETTGIGADMPGRVLPDVSFLADSTTGFLVGQTQTPDGADPASGVDTYSEYRIGGTSVSSPLFAGLMADAVQAVRQDKGANNANIGFVNPTMYKFQALNNGAFHDPSLGRAAGTKRDGGTQAQTLSDATTTSGTTTAMAGIGPGVVPVLADVRSDYADPADRTTTATQSLRTLGNLGTLHDDPGFDDSTGLGTPYAPNFINDFLTKPEIVNVAIANPTTAPAATVASGTSTTTSTATTTPTTPTVAISPGPVGGQSVTTSCRTVRGSAIKVYGPKTAKLNRRGQTAYSFKLFVNLGKCKTPSAVGRRLGVYVDGKRVATLRTGKRGVIEYRVRLKPGKHNITAAFIGNRDLKRSASRKFTAKAIEHAY